MSPSKSTHISLKDSDTDTTVQFSSEKIIPRGNPLDTLCATLEKKMQFEEGERGKYIYAQTHAPIINLERVITQSLRSCYASTQV
jgi:hypothetical protein